MLEDGQLLGVITQLSGASSLNLIKSVAKHGITSCPSWQGLVPRLKDIASRPCWAGQCTLCRECPSLETRIARGLAAFVGKTIFRGSRTRVHLGKELLILNDRVHSAVLQKSRLSQLDCNWCQ